MSAKQATKYPDCKKTATEKYQTAGIPWCIINLSQFKAPVCAGKKVIYNS